MVKCRTCPNEINKREFRNALAVKEFTISGMCQACQDSVFAPDHTQSGHAQFFSFVETEYVKKYGRASVCNHHELKAILAKSNVLSIVLAMMHDRVGQPSPRSNMAYANLPRNFSTEFNMSKPARRWESFSLEVRGKAIDYLANIGIFVWQRDFDHNSAKVTDVCRHIEDGTDIPAPKDLHSPKLSFIRGNFPEIPAEWEYRRAVMR